MREEHNADLTGPCYQQTEGPSAGDSTALQYNARIVGYKFLHQQTITQPTKQMFGCNVPEG
jgi:hypothetical protein